MYIRKVFSFLLFLIFFGFTNNFAYSLPRSSDLLKLLPDKVGTWTAVGQSSNWTRIVGNNKLRLNKQTTRNVYKIYKDGDKKIKVAIYAGGSIKNSLKSNNQIDNTSGKLKECERNRDKTNIQGFNASTITLRCPNISGNIVKITFINDKDKDFHYYLRVSSFVPNNSTSTNINTSAIAVEPVSLEDMINFVNALDLKSISAKIKQ